MKRFIAIIALSSLCTLLSAQVKTIPDLFVQMPMDKTPYLTLNDRKEMVECWNQHLDTRVTNRLGGMSSIDTLSADYGSIRLSEAKTMELFLLTEDESSVVVLLTTVKTPLPEGKLEVFDTEWHKVCDSESLGLKETDFLQKPDTMSLERYDSLCCLVSMPIYRFEYDREQKVIFVVMDTEMVTKEEREQLRCVICKRMLTNYGLMLKLR